MITKMFIKSVTPKSIMFCRKRKRSFLWLCLVLFPIFMSTGCVSGPIGNVVGTASIRGRITETPTSAVRVHDNPDGELLEVLFHVRTRNDRFKLIQTDAPRIVSIPYGELRLFELCDKSDLEVSHLLSLPRLITEHYSHSNCFGPNGSYAASSAIRPTPWSTEQMQLTARPESQYLDVHPATWRGPDWFFEKEKERVRKEKELVRIVGMLKNDQAVEIILNDFDIPLYKDRTSPGVLIPWRSKVLYVQYPNNREADPPGTGWRRVIFTPLFLPAIAADTVLTPVYSIVMIPSYVLVYLFYLK